ncbi:MAG: hypothetical protein RL742_699 [Bacteroidota bacterium]|jgi:hypothetical protein
MSIDDPLNKKIFCSVACFLIFSKKNQKTGHRTSFYFAAGGGEITRIMSPLRGLANQLRKVFDMNAFRAALVTFWGTALPAVAWALSGGPIQATLSANPATCAGKNDGQIQISLMMGATPASYQWQNTATGLSGSGTLTSALPMGAISGLAAGSYQVTLTDASGMDTVLSASVSEPLPLSASLQVISNYNGFQVACAGGSDGRAQAFVSGGTPPYSYLWSSGETAGLAIALQPGLASLEIRDAQQCPAFLSVLLAAPPPITVLLDVEGEKCFGENNGRIEITQVAGGLPPYAYRLNSGPANYQTVWEDLLPGGYFLTIQDGNGCEKLEGAVLPVGLEFIFDAGPDQEIFTGDTLNLQFTADRPVDSLLFFPPGAAVGSGVDAAIFPRFNTEFRVVALDENGCAAEDEFYVTVHRRRDLYAPNALMPGGDFNANRFFTLYSSGGVRAIQILQVFDRQGRQVFEKRDFPSDQPAAGWDGRMGAEEAPAGVYFWHAMVQYTDGRVEKMTGDVTLLR